jgi:hypothetical protein
VYRDRRDDEADADQLASARDLRQDDDSHDRRSRRQERDEQRVGGAAEKLSQNDRQVRLNALGDAGLCPRSRKESRYSRSLRPCPAPPSAPSRRALIP